MLLFLIWRGAQPENFLSSLGTQKKILIKAALLFFFLEHAGELRIFILREKEQSNYKIIPHLGP